MSSCARLLWRKRFVLPPPVPPADNAKATRPRYFRNIAIIVLSLSGFAVLLRGCQQVLIGDSHQLSPSCRLYETSLDGEPWYKVESGKHETEFGPFFQYVDGVCEDGDCVYIWVNGSKAPDYYCIDTGKDTCTRLHILPSHVRFITAKEYLESYWW